MDTSIKQSPISILMIRGMLLIVITLLSIFLLLPLTEDPELTNSLPFISWIMTMISAGTIASQIKIGTLQTNILGISKFPVNINSIPGRPLITAMTQAMIIFMSLLISYGALLSALLFNTAIVWMLFVGDNPLPYIWGILIITVTAVVSLIVFWASILLSNTILKQIL